MEIIMAAALILFAYLFARNGAAVVNRMNSEKNPEKICIVLDAGHGGWDPGKEGINGAEEKTLNLKIVMRLKTLREAEGIEVVLTREDDGGLYSKEASNKKVQDMKKRCEIITDTMPVFTVSIHQNSYPEEYVKGAQTFYYGKSPEGKLLAETIQASMAKRLDKENHRQAKANDSYYLKRTPTPTVIVECGFLSNYEEAELLVSKAYQKRWPGPYIWGLCSI